MTILERLHESEINASIASFWHGCWTAKLGDAMNGFTAERACSSYAEAEGFLAAEAACQFPHSRFAKSPEMPAEAAIARTATLEWFCCSEVGRERLAFRAQWCAWRHGLAFSQAVADRTLVVTVTGDADEVERYVSAIQYVLN